MVTYHIDLEPVGRRVDVPPGTTLLEAAQAAGVEIVSICGGGGSCGTCRIRLAQGRLSPLSLVEEGELSAEEIRSGVRLACQAEPRGDVRIEIPPESLTTPQRLSVEGQGVETDPAPAIIPVDVSLPPPDLYDLRSDAGRLVAALQALGYPEVEIPLPVLSELSEQLRAQNWTARLALRGNEVVGILPFVVPSAPRLYGLAVDVGTTKLAAYLVDLETGVTAAKAGAMNPQISYGEDVVSRIAYTNNHPVGRRTLQTRLVDEVNKLLGDLCHSAGVPRAAVVDGVIVGNTAMHHLFAGLPVSQLGMAPYVPAVSAAMDFPAHLTGLELAPGAYVHLPPNIAGYVGADHVAMLLAMDVAHAPEVTIALDIGTNTEITLSLPGPGRNRLLSCSCASGPAFEGAHIQDGMRAAEGAIERVQIQDGEVLAHTIGNVPPVGICGSGILDAVAQLLEAGILDVRGVIRPGHPRVRISNGRGEFVLATSGTTGHRHDIIVNRSDVHEIQLAKGAIRAGVEVLLSIAGLADADIKRFIVAGAFGTYLDLESAVRIGMFPPLPLERFVQVGNAAGSGARQLLVSTASRQEAARIVEQIEYIELTTHLDFTNEFVKALLFPDTDPKPDP